MNINNDLTNDVAAPLAFVNEYTASVRDIICNSGEGSPAIALFDIEAQSRSVFANPLLLDKRIRLNYFSRLELIYENRGKETTYTSIIDERRANYIARVDETLPTISEWFPYERGSFTFCRRCNRYTVVTRDCEHTVFILYSCFYCEDAPYRAQALLSDEAHEDITSKMACVRNWLMSGHRHGKSILSTYTKISPDLDKYINLIEDILILMHGLFQSKNTIDRYIAVTTFCKLRGSRFSFTMVVGQVFADIFGTYVSEKIKVDKQYKDLADHVDEQIYVAQGEGAEDFFDAFRKYLNFYDSLKHTTIYKKIQKFTFYLLTLGLLSNVNIDFRSLKYSKAEEAAIKRTHQPGFDMVHCMLDTVCFICERGIQLFKSGDYNVIFHSGGTYEKWLNSATTLIKNSKFLNNPEAHGINKFSFISELRDCIEKGKAIVKYTHNMDRAEKLYLQKMLNDLNMIEAEEMTRKSAQQPRKDPFAVLIHGSSNICKSQLKEILFSHYAKVFGLPDGDEFKYTRCPTDEYWSGFNTSQWCIVMDDIAFLKPNGEVDPTLSELLQVKNSVPYCPPQAALEDKGRTPVKAELLIATTNIKDLNLHAYFACPFAIARRMSYVISAVVKPEFVKNGFMADSTKIPATEPGMYMDIWKFEVSVPIPESDVEKDGQRTKYEVKYVFSDINDLTQWFIKAAKEHQESQSKASSALDSMRGVEVCMKCYRNVKKCICDDDSGDESFEETNQRNVAEWCSERTCVDCNEYPCVCKLYQSKKKYTPQGDIDTSDFTKWYRLKLLLLGKIIAGEVNNYPLFVEEAWMSYSHIFLNNKIAIVNLFLILFYASYWVIFLMLLLGLLAFSYRYIFVFLHFLAEAHWGSYWKLSLAKRICTSELQSWKLIFRLAGNKIENMHFSDAGLKKLAVFLSSATVLLFLAKFLHRKREKPSPKHFYECAGCETCDEWTKEEKEENAHLFICKDFNCARCKQFKAQGLTGSVPVPHDFEKPTFYYHDPYKITDLDISGASKCSPSEQIHKYVIRNTAKFHIKFDDKDTIQASTAVNVKGNIWMLNKHIFKKYKSGILNVVFESVEQNVSRNMKGIRFVEDSIIEIPDTDLCFMQLRALPPGPDISKYFTIDKILDGCYAGVYHMISKSGDRSIRPVVNIRKGTDPAHLVPAYHGVVNIPTEPGDCGSLCVAKVGDATVILGMHVSGNGFSGVYFQHISQKIIERILGKYEPQVDSGDLPISAKGCYRELVPLHPKSTIRWIEKGTAEVMGSFAGYRPKHKSRVKKTFICEEIKKLGYKDDYGPPDMSWKPWNLALNDMTQPNHAFRESILKECEDAYVNDIFTELGDKINSLEVYTQEVALNGVDGVTFVDRINTGTSAGNPYKKSKKHFLEMDENNHIVKLDSAIQERVDEIEECYSKGKRFHPQFCAHLKDEPTSYKKIEAGKTRVFTGAEFAWSIVVRKFFLSHIRLIQNNPYVFEAMPGIVAQSVEWDNLYKHLTKFGKDTIIAGDYAKFDKKMAAPFILTAFKILIRMSEKAGWPKDQLIVLWCIAMDTAFAHIDFNGDYIEIQGNPSGHPLTVIINCIVNSLYMRYAFKLCTARPVTLFKQFVALVTYGDDNTQGVSKLCPTYNHTRIAVALKLIGVIYTMADKEAESVPYIHIDDASFLKRKFVYDSDMDIVLAPLDSSSFDKMLTSYVDNGTLTPESHAICVIETAIREYFFYGKEVFHKKRDMFIKLVDECNLKNWIRPSTFPTYNELAYEFWMRFNDTERAKTFQN